jgi:hypothetical protein
LISLPKVNNIRNQVEERKEERVFSHAEAVKDIKEG